MPPLRESQLVGSTSQEEGLSLICKQWARAEKQEKQHFRLADASLSPKECMQNGNSQLGVLLSRRAMGKN